MTDRLVELLEDTLHEWECDVQPETLSQIAEHLIENGVIAPPVSINDIVYTIVKDKIVPHRVERVEIHHDNSISFCFSWHGMGYEHKFTKDIGKTVFLTKEEAEAKLKEREGE